VKRILEEAMDTFCFALFLVGILSAFSGFFRDCYQLDCMEYMAESFLDEAERKQSISGDAYEIFVHQINEMQDEFCVSLTLQGKRAIPQYKPAWIEGKCYFYYTGEVKEEPFELSHDNILTWLEERGNLVLEQGDCIRICVQKMGADYSLIQKIIRR